MAVASEHNRPTRTVPDIENPADQGARIRRFAVVALDVVALMVGVVAADWLLGPDALDRVLVVLFAVAFWLFVVNANLYNSRLASNRREETTRIARSGTRAFLVVAASSVLVPLDLPLRSASVVLAVTVGAMAIERELVRWWFTRRRQAGRGLWNSVLVAGEEQAAGFRERIEADRSSPHTIVAHVDPSQCPDAEELLTRTVSMARNSGAHGVIVVESLLDATTANALVRGLLQARLYVDLASTLVDISTDRLATRSLGSGIATWIAPRPKSGWRGRAKRLFDVVVASAVLVVASPVFLLLMLAVKLTSEGPVFFRQQRVGRYGEPFDMLKFRSMVVNAEELLAELERENEGAGPLFKIKDDPRVTPLGRFMRKTSLDELPQLLNVLRNEMSLVGPRPALRAEMAEWEPALYARLDVKPGITGMWQVSGRSGTTFTEYTRLDLYYVHNWSLWVDVSILARTIPAVVRSDGAY